MSLLSDIEASIQSPGSKCGVTVLLATLTPVDAADLTTAVDNHAIPASAITAALKARGIRLADSTIGRHRRRGCKCP